MCHCRLDPDRHRSSPMTTYGSTPANVKGAVAFLMRLLEFGQPIFYRPSKTGACKSSVNFTGKARQHNIPGQLRLAQLWQCCCWFCYRLCASGSPRNLVWQQWSSLQEWEGREWTRHLLDCLVVFPEISTLLIHFWNKAFSWFVLNNTIILIYKQNVKIENN